MSEVVTVRYDGGPWDGTSHQSERPLIVGPLFVPDHVSDSGLDCYWLDTDTLVYHWMRGAGMDE